MNKLRAKDPKLAAPAKPKILIYGAPGVGKTFTSLDWPSVYYIDTEGGANLPHYTDKLKAAGGVYLGPEDGSNDFAMINEQIAALTSQEHDFRTLVIDSISKTFNTTVGAEAERLGAKDAFGASKKPAVAASRRMVDRLDRLPMNAIIIAHEKPEWGTKENGDRVEIGKTFDADEKLGYELHLVLYVQRRGKSRVAVVKKSRLTGFPEGETIPWNYAEIAERYGRDIIERKAAPLVIATPEQVAEFNALVSMIKIDAETITRWLNKAKAEAPEDFTSDQIQACINTLKDKFPKPQP